MREMMRKGGVANRIALGAVALLAGVAIVIAGCNKKTEELTGNTQLAGSTPMEGMCVVIREIPMEEEPGITVPAEYIGSTVDMGTSSEGTIDIGTSSRNLTQEELEKGAVENIVTRDGIAVILNKEVTGVKDLTLDKSRDILCGRATNWNEPGGPNIPVAVTGYEAGSGTGNPFEEILGTADQCRYVNELSGSGTVSIKTAVTQGAVGYISMALLGDTVQAVSTEEVQLTRENVQNESYPLNKTMVMATTGAIKKQNPLVQRYFEFVYSDQGQSLIDGVNLTPVPGEQKESRKSAAC